MQHRQQRHRLHVARACVLVFGLMGCGDGRVDPPAPPVVAAVRVRPTPPRGAPGDTVTIVAEPVDARGAAVPGAAVTWTWSDSTALAGEATGATLRARLLRPADVVVTARADGVAGTAQVSVRWPEPVAVRFTLPPADSLIVGAQRLVFAIAVDSLDRPIPAATVQLTSSDPTVADVRPSSAGPRLHALRPGRAEITATAGAVRAVVAVRVVPPPRYVWPDTSVLLPGNVRPLRLQALPEDQRPTVLAADRWASTDAGVATVAGDGTVTGLAPGRTTILAVLGADTLRATVIVRAPAPPLEFVALAARAPCAVSRDGGVYCWGVDQGQLGTDEPVDRCESFQPFSGAGRFWYQRSVTRCSALPVRVRSAARFVAAGGTGAGVCAVTDQQGLECWGNSVPTAARTSLLPVPVAPGLRVAAVDGPCLLTVDGEVHCWSLWSAPIFGDAQRESDLPRRVATPVRFRQIAAGPAHLCGVTAENAAYCWGSNVNDQLGVSGSVQAPGCFTVCEPAPKAVEGLGPTREVRPVGFTGTCALDPAGVARCWGSALMNGRRVSSPIPAPIPDAPPFATLASSAEAALAACGITAAGQTWCWGSLFYRPDGTQAQLTERAERAAPGVPVRQATLGPGWGCGLEPDGRVVCWGQGLLGDGVWAPDGGAFRVGRVAGQR